MQQFTSPRDGFPCEPHGEVRLQAKLSARLRHAFHEIENIGRPAARNRSHRIDIGFGRHPFDRTRHLQQILDQLPLAIAHACIGKSARHATPDHCGRIRHGAHHGRFSQMRFKRGERLAGCDGNDDSRLSHERLERRQNRVHELRLDGDEENARRQALRNFSDMACARIRNHFPHCFGRIGIDDDDRRARHTVFQPPGQQCATHIACADQNDRPGGCKCIGGLFTCHLTLRLPFQRVRLPWRGLHRARTIRRIGKPDSKPRRCQARWKAALPPAGWWAPPRRTRVATGGR